MKLSDKSKISTTRVAIVGLSGTGKSTLAAELSKKFKLYWFTLDNDSDILLKLPPEQQENVELFDIPDSASFPAAADTLMKLFTKKSGKICHKHGVFNCGHCTKIAPEEFSSIDFTTLDPKQDIVVIDTGSQLSHSVLAKATQGQSVDYKPERDDWGALRKWTEFFYSEFQAARFNLVVIFHAIEAEMEDGKSKLVPAFGSKDMSSKIAGAFSHVAFTDIVNKKHKVFTKSTEFANVLTKSRTDFDSSKMDSPSLIPLFETQQHGLQSSTASTVETKTIVSDTPGNKALTGLEALKAKMQGAK
jgi:hypothetical protein